MAPKIDPKISANVPLKKRKNKTPTATSKTMFRVSKPLFMHSFLQVNQSTQGKYNHSDYFRKQLTRTVKS